MRSKRLFEGEVESDEAKIAALELEKARAERIVNNRDVMSFLEEVFLEYGGLNYCTNEVSDEFVQGRVSMLNIIRLRLSLAKSAADKFAEFDKHFYARLYERRNRPLEEAAELKRKKKETKR